MMIDEGVVCAKKFMKEMAQPYSKNDDLGTTLLNRQQVQRLQRDMLPMGAGILGVADAGIGGGGASSSGSGRGAGTGVGAARARRDDHDMDDE